jgi:hypothetical protein
MRTNMLMNRVLLICLVIAPFIICSALTRRLKGGPVVFTRFPVERQLEETEVFKVNHFTPDGLQLYDDSLLFIRNKDNNSRQHFALFNLNNYIQDFAVTKNDSLLYTYNPNSKFIKVANLSTVH